MTPAMRQWAIDLLHTLGNKNPSPSAIAFVAGWAQHESGGSLSNGCFKNNPLSVAGSSAGSTPQGCGAGSNAGVNSFPSYWAGVNATASRLNESGYGNILKALKTNDTTSLGMTGHPSNGIATDLTYWLNGTRTIDQGYVNAILSAAGSGLAGVGQGGSSAPSTAGDACLACGTKGSPAYISCTAQIAIGFVPNCAKAAYEQSQANTGNNLIKGIVSPVQPLVDWLNQTLPAIGIRIGLFVGALVLVIVALWMLTRNPVEDVKGGISSGLNSGARAVLHLPPKGKKRAGAVKNNPYKPGGAEYKKFGNWKRREASR